jgi:hypothetical protein
MVANAGFTLACGVFTGPPTFAADPYQIRRIAVRNSTGPLAFGMMLQTPYQYYEWLRWKVGRVIANVKDKRDDAHSSAAEKDRVIAQRTKSTE